MSQQDLDQLPNEKLNALAAELLGWHLVTAPSWGYPEGEASWDYENEVMARVSNWRPTAEGHEHQAMMVVRKMRKDGWSLELHVPRHPGFKSFAIFYPKKDEPESRADDEIVGRAIVLAALKAKGE